MCDRKHCGNKPTLTYYSREICDDCFDKHCDGKIDLKKEFKVKT